jgi:hypothetical protein
MRTILSAACYGLLFVSGIAVHTAFAGGELVPSGARGAGISNASVTLCDVWSNLNNQAGLAALDHWAAGIHHENAFGMKELSFQSFVLALPVRGGTFGFNYSRFGYKLYNESKGGLAYAKKLGRRIAAGIQLDYVNVSIPTESKRSHATTFEGGIIADISGTLSLGVHIFNPLSLKYLNSEGDRVNTVMKLGSDWQPLNTFLLAIEIEKALDKPPDFHAGAEYLVFKNLVLRAGISTNPVQNSFGTGLVFKSFRLELAFSHHPELGFTPYCSLSYGLEQ